MVRRRWLRLLIVLAIAFPLLLEGMTFIGLVDRGLFGGSPAPTTTPDQEPRVGIGDELLNETGPVETMTDAEIRTGDEEWILTITGSVHNTANRSYEFRLSRVELDDGRGVAGGGSTGRIPPRGKETVVGRWSTPPGSTPRTLTVIGVFYVEDGHGASTISRTVRLGKIPVRGGA